MANRLIKRNKAPKNQLFVLNLSINDLMFEHELIREKKSILPSATRNLINKRVYNMFKSGYFKKINQ